MTVVAIIGALAALGVPQYKKMQRKAKRAEANMVLGVIGSAEAAFYAEYNGYGNSMGGIGAEMDNDPQYYHVGFFSSGVSSIATPSFWEFGGAVAAVPNQFPGYNSAGIRPPGCSGTTTNVVSTAINGCYTIAGSTASSAVPRPSNNTCAENGSVSHNGSRPIFTAIAKGNLYQNAASASAEDCVTMNHMREIRITQDGT